MAMNTPYSNPYALSEETNFSYPSNIAKIPYASFLKIKKYAYDKGMATVGKQQNDAIGAFQNSKLMQNITDGLAERAQDIFSDGTGGQNLIQDLDRQEAIDEARRRTQTWQNRLNFFNWNDDWVDRRSDEDILNETFNVDKNWLGQGGETVTMGDLLQTKQDAINFNNAGYKQTYVDLAMPNEFQYDYGANWNNTFKLGTMALFADDPGRMSQILVGGGTIGGVIGGLSTTLGQEDQLGTIITEGVKSGTEKAGNLFGVNSNILDPTNVVGMAGLAPNENAIQFFKKMEFRSFEFNFEFAARNKTESTEIQKILQWFKVGMHPVSQQVDGSGSGVLLGFPDVWVLEPRFTPPGEKGLMSEAGTDQPHPMMPQTKLCALVGMRVNTTPYGEFSTVFDGSIPLVTVSLKFNELTALTRSDFMTNPYL